MHTAVRPPAIRKTTVEIVAPKHVCRSIFAVGRVEQAHFRCVDQMTTDPKAFRLFLAEIHEDWWRPALDRAVSEAPTDGNFDLVLYCAGEKKAALDETVARFQDVSAFLATVRPLHREPYWAADLAELKRISFAYRQGAQERLIASARIDAGVLTVWSCARTPYLASIKKIAPLAGLDASSMRDFRVSESGSRIHWHAADIDLDLDAVRYHADAVFRRQVDADRRAWVHSYCKVIKRFRMAAGLSQRDFPGLDARQVRRIENGETLPQAKTLACLAKGHGLPIAEYLERVGALAGRATT